MTYVFLAAAVLFLSSGNLVWADGWYYVVAVGLAQLATAWTLAFDYPDVLCERSAALTGEAVEAWDRWLAPLATFAPLTILLVAGLADRLRWAPAFVPCATAAGVGLFAAAGPRWASGRSRPTRFTRR